MRFPVFPEVHRKMAGATLRCRKPMIFLSILGVLTFLLGSILDHEGVLIAGIISSFIFIYLLILTITAGNAMMWVEFEENALRLVDKKGDVLRSTEYKYIRHMEVRMIGLSLEPRARNHLDRFTYRAWEGKMILAYVNSAECFKDLKLYEVDGYKRPFYSCDEITFHPNCIAFAYDEKAWELLQRHVCKTRTGV